MDEQPRKKRHLISCDICRYRRIKCVRNNLDEVCQECRKRGFSCTSEHVKTRKVPPRTGKRLEIIKSTINNSNSTIQDNFSEKPSELTQETRFFNKKVSPELQKHLFQVFLRHPHIHLPTGCWYTYYESFLRHGNDYEKMYPDEALVCLCALAYGARWSGSEDIVGSNEDFISPFSQAQKDFSSWGYRRDAFCIDLVTRIRMFHQMKGVGKIISKHAIRGTILLLDLWIGVSEDTNGQHLQTAEIAALLRMYEREKANFSLPPEDYSPESLANLPPMILEDDIKLANPELLNLNPYRIRQIIAKGKAWDVAEISLVGMVYLTARFKRYAFDHVIGPVPKRNVVFDVQALRTFMQKADELSDLFDLFLQRSKNIFRPDRLVLPFHWMQNLQFAVGTTLVFVYKAVLSVLDSKGTSELELRLSEMREKHIFDYARYFSDLLALNGGKLPLGGHLVLEDAYYLSTILLETKTLEEGGDKPGYTINEKLKILNIYKDSFVRNAWAWPQSGDKAKDLDAKIVNFRSSIPAHLRTPEQSLVITNETVISTFNLRPFETQDYNLRDMWSLNYLIYGDASNSDLLGSINNSSSKPTSMFDVSNRALYTLSDVAESNTLSNSSSSSPDNESNPTPQTAESISNNTDGSPPVSRLPTAEDTNGNNDFFSDQYLLAHSLTTCMPQLESNITDVNATIKKAMSMKPETSSLAEMLSNNPFRFKAMAATPIDSSDVSSSSQSPYDQPSGSPFLHSSGSSSSSTSTSTPPVQFSAVSAASLQIPFSTGSEQLFTQQMSQNDMVSSNSSVANFVTSTPSSTSSTSSTSLAYTKQTHDLSAADFGLQPVAIDMFSQPPPLPQEQDPNMWFLNINNNGLADDAVMMDRDVQQNQQNQQQQRHSSNHSNNHTKNIFSFE